MNQWFTDERRVLDLYHENLYIATKDSKDRKCGNARVDLFFFNDLQEKKKGNSSSVRLSSTTTIIASLVCNVRIATFNSVNSVVANGMLSTRIKVAKSMPNG